MHKKAKEYEERKFAEIIQNYDFIVCSKYAKRKLMEVLPEGANIIYSPYIENAATVYVIKKYDIRDLLEERGDI